MVGTHWIVRLSALVAAAAAQGDWKFEPHPDSPIKSLDELQAKAGAQDDEEPAAEDIDESLVETLDEFEFEDRLADQRLAIVKFVQSFDKASKKLRPQFAAAAKKLKKDGVYFGTVDAAESKDLVAKMGMAKFPVMKIFRYGVEASRGVPTPSEFPTNSKGIVKLLRALKTAVVELKKEKDLDAFLERKGLRVVGVFPEKNSEARKVFEKAFSKHADRMVEAAAEVSAPELLPRFTELAEKRNATHDPSKPAVFIFNPELTTAKKEPPYVILGNYSFMSEDHLLTFTALSTPMVLESGPQSDELLIYRQMRHSIPPKPLVTLWFFWDAETEKEKHLADSRNARYWIRQFREAVEPYRQNFTFAVTNLAKVAEEEIYRQLSEHGATLSKHAFAITARAAPPELHHKWGFSESINDDLSFNTEGVQSWLQGIQSGEVGRYKLSETPAPYDPTSHEVFKLTHQSIENVLETCEEDVLIMFYADWCEGCKKWMPNYLDFAKKWAKKNPKLKLSTYNIDRNEDAPEVFELERVPTFWLVPAKEKDSPVKYENDVGFSQDYKDMTKWLKSHTSNPWKKGKKQQEEAEEEEAEEVGERIEL